MSSPTLPNIGQLMSEGLRGTTTANFTNFLTDRKVLIVSDIEGYTSIGLKNKLKKFVSLKEEQNGERYIPSGEKKTEYKRNEKLNIIDVFNKTNRTHTTLKDLEILLKTGLIYNGDLSDYTTIAKIEISEKTKERFCYLELLKFFQDNKDNVRATIGNRDMNKLNVYHLLQFENFYNNRWWKKDSEIKFKSGDHKAIIDIARNLHKRSKDPNNEIPWLVKDLTNFFPYWNSGNPAIQNWRGWKSVKKDGKPSYLSLHDRFLAIFGADPSAGFMSAPNTLYGIPIELGLIKEAMELNKLEKEPKLNESDRMKKEELQNFFSAIVFTVYARILDPSLASEPKWMYDGCLYKYLKENVVVGYAENEKNLYLFSHGGVYSSFTQNLPEQLRNLTFRVIEPDFYPNKTEIITEIQKPPPQQQQGGQIDNTAAFDDFNWTIHSYIDTFYSYFQGPPLKEGTVKFINISLDKTPIPEAAILTAMSTYFMNNKILNKRFKLSEQNNVTQTFKDVDMQLRSPIQSGYPYISRDEKPLFTTSTPTKQIVNIFGHQPTGYGYTFGTSINGNKIVCSDFSNTFSKSDEIRALDSYNLALYLDFNKDRFILDGIVMIDSNVLYDYGDGDKDGRILDNSHLLSENDKFRQFIKAIPQINPIDGSKKISVTKNSGHETDVSQNEIGLYFQNQEIYVNDDGDESKDFFPAYDPEMGFQKIYHGIGTVIIPYMGNPSVKGNNTDFDPLKRDRTKLKLKYQNVKVYTIKKNDKISDYRKTLKLVPINTRLDKTKIENLNAAIALKNPRFAETVEELERKQEEERILAQAKVNAGERGTAVPGTVLPGLSDPQPQVLQLQGNGNEEGFGFGNEVNGRGFAGGSRKLRTKKKPVRKTKKHSNKLNKGHKKSRRSVRKH